MITLRIDGLSVQAREGETLLTAAKRAGIPIPTLCHHEAVEDAGACRLCMVEISKADWGDWKGIVTACLYPVEEGLRVDTKAGAVMESRRETLDLLLARCPQTPQIKELAAEYGVYETSYARREEDDHCILCGICTRICAALGHHAISIINRGPEKTVSTPFGEPSTTCVGCGACARNCPTGAIPVEESGGLRKIWDREFPLVACADCGRAYITENQRDHLCQTRGFDPSYFDKCDACRRAEVSETIAGIVKW
jgi:NADH dehydrogenase/NADH:ubiquinone oxidoreductase subunit G